MALPVGHLLGKTQGYKTPVETWRGTLEENCIRQEVNKDQRERGCWTHRNRRLSIVGGD
jgi:hypothetical protein